MSGFTGLIANPFFDMDVFFCVSLVVAGLVWAMGYKTWGIRLVLLVLIPFFILTLTPCGSWLLMRTENHYPEQTSVAPKVAGMIVLGGGIDDVEGNTRQQPLYGASSGRVVEALRVAQKNPSLKILLTGRPGEVDLTKKLFEENHIDPRRLILETHSNSTLKNAQESYKLVRPGSQPWILVTSAFHMKRAVDDFEHTGWTVIPYPVDYKTAGSFKVFKAGSAGRQSFWLVAREWLARI